MDLPKGIALVRMQSGDHRSVLVSRRLTPEQERTARVMAVVLAAQGLPLIVLSMVDVLAAIHDSAA